MKATPGRLLNEAYFTDHLQVRAERQALDRPYLLHWHEFYELTFVLSGHGTNTVNGETHVLAPGDLFLLTPTDFHAISPDPGTTLQLYNLNFSQAMLSCEMVNLIFSNKTGNHAHFCAERGYAAMLFRFDSIASECNGNAQGRDVLVHSELNCVLIEWHRHQTRATDVDATRLAHHCHSGIQKSLIYIHHNFRQPLCLEDAAKHAHLSSNYYSELFRKSTGVTFQRYLQRLRLQFAHALLRTSSLPVTEVSYASGFNTLTHFERAFRLCFSMTPSAVQKRRSQQAS